jgi:CubicO group peptidase (beta-lactamase class C family)
MRKRLKRFFVALALVGTVLLMAAVAVVYFSVADTIEIEGEIPRFKNNQHIVRLDSQVLSSDSITRYVSALMDKADVHGMGISIINNNNNLVYQHYFGFKNKQKGQRLEPGSIFYGASFSKTILADIVLQLVGENRLQLDTPLYRYLEEPLYSYRTNLVQQVFGANFIDYSGLESDDRHKKLTARMCLSHTTGLPNWRWLEPDKRLTIKFEPGTRYHYSGEGMVLLQFVIEKLTRKTFEEIAVEKVFQPLGLLRSSFVWQRAYEGNYAVGHDAYGRDLRIPKQNVANAAGSLSTTLEDYTTFFKSILQQKEDRHRKLITPQITIKSKQQFGPNALVDVNDNDTIRLSYGLGFGLYQTHHGKAFFKEGHLEGWQHYAVGFPSKGIGLVVMSNSDNAESIYKELIEFTLANYSTPWFWEGYIPYDYK